MNLKSYRMLNESVLGRLNLFPPHLHFIQPFPLQKGLELTRVLDCQVIGRETPSFL